MKYVIIQIGSVKYGIVFPEEIEHVRFLGFRPISAGFCNTDPDTGKFNCWGNSVSLDVCSSPGDEEILARSFRKF